MKKFKHAAVGGTFDQFHTGHKHILLSAFQNAEKVTIGITQDSLLGKKEFRNSIQPYIERKKQVINYLRQNNLETKANIVSLEDSFGPAIKDETMDAIFVSKETRANAVHINKIRKQSHLPLLKIFTINFIKSNDRKIIRSSRIRKGEINNVGTNYLYLFKNNTLILPPHLKDKLRQPFGKVIKGNDTDIKKTAKKAINTIKQKQYEMIISVGDVVTSSLLKEKLEPDIKIIDKKTQRKEFIHTNNFNISSFSKNSAGKIQKKAVFELNRKIKTYLLTGKSSTLLIKGEEDLLALPAMLLAPLQSVVIYGQTNIGMVLVEITTQLKEKVEKILSEFN